MKSERKAGQLTEEQKAAVNGQLRQGASARQAAARLGLTKSYVDAYLVEIVKDFARIAVGTAVSVAP